MEILKNPGVVIRLTNNTAIKQTIGKNKRIDVTAFIFSFTLLIVVTSRYCLHDIFLC